jgi:hypothetical protein
VIQYSIVLAACAKGLGMSLDLIGLGVQEEMQKMYYTSNIFFVVAIVTAKISVLSLLHRIIRVREHRTISIPLMSIIGVWSIASVFSVALQSELSSPWISVGARCSGTVKVA